jgi:hypothetical protein
MNHELSTLDPAPYPTVRRVARFKATLRGGDVGRLLGLAPALLLAPEAQVQAAVAAVAVEVAAARALKGQPTLLLGSAAMQRRGGRWGAI